MVAKPSPVTPEVLRWAVDEDGRTMPELAQALKVDVDMLDGWVSGDVTLTRGQVTDLANVLQRPRALFFLPRPPEPATLPPSFRHPPGEDRVVSATARRKVRQARRLQHAVSWAFKDTPPVEVPRSTLDSDPDYAAERAREWLAIADSEQASWRDDRAALRAWREALEDQGVLVFVLEIGRDDVRGFSAWDDHAPLIVANLTGVSPAARIFTLAHELGHLVARQDAACVEPREDSLVGADLERWCERFGAALLMPPADIRVLADKRHISTRAADLNDVRAVMRRFRVSARAAAVRLIDMGYGTRALYKEVLSTFVPTPPPPDAKIARPPRSVARVREYGPRTVRAVLTTLPPRDALSVLRITVEDLRRMANEVPGVPVF